MKNKTEVWKQASEIFAEVSEFSVKHAIAHLYGIENISPEVRNAVITLINAGSQASQYFNDNISPSYNITFNNTQNFQPGQQLDDYELLEELGKGGMSQVFKAKRLSSDKQTYVAIKVFAPRNDSKELFIHFINEQKILSELSHPHIVKMLHDGLTDDNIAYLVMELIEGAQPLDSFCHNNKLELKNIVQIIAQCADALAYSHANLIIHRDLKPDNILIGKNQELKIVDFGIAKLINKDLSGSKTTIMALTPNYAAPEQINSKQITVKTDIFSLAVVALDLINKENPLPKDRLIKSCANDEAHLDRVLKSLNCNKDLKNILRKSLEQEPNKRYSSMQSFADDLNNYLNNQPVNATSQSFIYRIKKFAKRRSALFATMLSFVAFLLMGSFFGYQQYKQIKIEAEKANQVKQFMLDSFEITNPDNSEGTKISADNLLKFATTKIQKNKELNKQIKFELLQTIAIAYGNLGYYKLAIENLNYSLDIQKNNTKSQSYLAKYLLNSSKIEKLNSLLSSINIEPISDYSDKSRLYRVKSSLLAQNSDFKGAHELYQKSYKLETFANNSTGIISSKKLLAEILFLQSKLTDAITVLEKTLHNSSKETNQTLIMSIQSNLVDYYNKIGNYDKALKEIKLIISKQRKILGDQHPDLGRSLETQSSLYLNTGNFKESKKSAQESYRIYKGLYGENNPATATAINQLAVLAYMKQDMTQAKKYLLEVVDIMESFYPPEHNDVLQAKTNLAALYTSMHQPEIAVTLLRDIYRIRVRVLGQNHLSTIYTKHHLINALSYSGEYDDAIKLAEENIKIVVDNYGVNDSITVDAYAVLARTYQKSKMFEKALNVYKKIEENNYYANDNPKFPVLLLAIAETSFKLNLKEQADVYFLKCINTYKNLFSEKHPLTLKAQLKYANYLLTYKRYKEMQLLLNEVDIIVAQEKILNKPILSDLKNLKVQMIKVQ